MFQPSQLLSTENMLGISIALLRNAAESLRNTTAPSTEELDEKQVPPMDDLEPESKNGSADTRHTSEGYLATQSTNGKAASPIFHDGSGLARGGAQTSSPCYGDAINTVQRKFTPIDKEDEWTLRDGQGVSPQNDQVNNGPSTPKKTDKLSKTAIPSPGFRGPLPSVSSMVLRGRQTGSRLLFGALFGSDTTGQSSVGEGISLSGGISSASTTRNKNTSVTMRRRDGYPLVRHDYQPCGCMYCAKERELRWQLFLLREQQEEAMNPQSLNHQRKLHLQLLSADAQELPSSSYQTLSSIDDILDSNSYQPQPNYFSTGRPTSAGHFEYPSTSQSQNPTPLIQRVAALVTFQFIVFLRYLYPKAKALLQYLIHLEREHCIRERVVNRICLMMGWVWRVLIVGGLGWFLSSSPEVTYHDDEGQEKEEDEVEDRKSGRGRQKREEDESVMVKEYFQQALAEIISGVCEGVEGGVKVWCGTVNPV